MAELLASVKKLFREDMKETLRRIDCWDTIRMRSIKCLVVCKSVGTEALVGFVELLVVLLLSGARDVRRRLKMLRQSQSKKVRKGT